MGDSRQGEPGSARHELWWAIWDNYTENVKAALIDNLIIEHSAGKTAEWLARKIWTELDWGNRLDPDDLIRLLETSGFPCPPDLED